MSDVPVHHQDHHTGGTRILWFPLLASIALVIFTLTVVAYGQLTGHGVIKTGANQISELGQITVFQKADGTIEVVAPATKEVLASYPPSSQQFMAGALRSLERMSGQGAGETGRRYSVVQVGNAMVFLTDEQTGDKVSLNAFNRAESVALADKVAAANGGNQ